MTRLTIIAAVARNGVIGDGPRIPWKVPGEQATFRETTMGHTLLMGRATFDSIGRPLPGRRTIVLTRDPSWHAGGVETAHTFTEALALAGVADEVFVAGGAQVYAEALPFAHRMLLSEVDVEPEGDVHFPHWDPTAWRETSRVPHEGFSVVDYTRVGR